MLMGGLRLQELREVRGNSAKSAEASALFCWLCPSSSAESRKKRQEHQKRLSGVADELQSQATASDVVICRANAKVWNRRAVIIPLPLRGRWRKAFSRPRCEAFTTHTTPSKKRLSQALVLKALQQAGFYALQTKSGKNPEVECCTSFLKRFLPS